MRAVWSSQISKNIFSNIVWNYLLLVWNNLYFRQGYDIRTNSSYLRNVPLPLPGEENPLSLRTSNSAIGLNKDSEVTTSPSAITGLYCTVSSLLDPSVRELLCRKEYIHNYNIRTYLNREKLWKNTRGCALVMRGFISVPWGHQCSIRGALRTAHEQCEFSWPFP